MYLDYSFTKMYKWLPKKNLEVKTELWIDSETPEGHRCTLEKTVPASEVP